MMKEEKLIFVLGAYLKQHRKIIFLLPCFVLISSFVFYLYSLPAEAAVYAGLLCLCPGTIVAAFDFIHYYRKHKKLCRMRNSIVNELKEESSCDGLIEEDYRKLLECLYHDKMRLVTEMDRQNSEMIDYYTLWVHQIKTPIAAMRLLMQSGEKKEKELDLELFKIEHYVEMVLNYLRMASDTSDLLIAEYDLDNIIKQAVRKYAKSFIYKRLSLNYIPTECRVLTDEKWLLFVIEQILSNSLKYTNKGGISIYLEDREKKILVIEDTGIGIWEEDLPRVFEKGFTGYNGRTDKKSTGIGLYLCKNILKRLSHTIRIESKEGRGTRVKIGLKMIEMEIE